MPDEAAPDDELLSIREANRRRPGIGTFLLGLAVFGLIAFPLIALTMSVFGDRKGFARYTMEMTAGSLFAGAAASIWACKALTRWRGRQIDREKQTSPMR